MLLFVSLSLAGPMQSSLSDVLTECPDIVVARMIPGEYPEMPSLEIERAIRGNLSGTVHPTRGQGYPPLLTDSRVIAFLCDDLEWSVVATPVHDDNIGGWLNVFGFYDFNAHMVDPPILTLGQLDMLMAGQQPTWGFSGPLVALSEDGQRMESVGPELQVWTNGSEFGVTGIEVAELAPTAVHLWGWQEDQIRVDFNRTTRRPLTLMGRFVDGQMRFVVEEPTLLTVPEVRGYLADATQLTPNHQLRIVWDDGEVWEADTGVYGESIQWKTPTVSLPMGELSIAPERYMGIGENTLALGEGPPGLELQGRGAMGTLLREVLRGPVAVTVTAGSNVGRTGQLQRVRVLDE